MMTIKEFIIDIPINQLKTINLYQLDLNIFKENFKH